MAAIDSAAVAAITAPHLLYAFIWFMPELWRKVFPKPIRAFQLSASILKGRLAATYGEAELKLIIGNVRSVLSYSVTYLTNMLCMQCCKLWLSLSGTL